MSEFIRQRLLDNNVATAQLLGLCPLLAVSNSVVNALGLGAATLLVLMLTNASVSLIRPLLIKEVRIPLFVLLIAAVVTAVEMLMNAYFHQLYLVLGIFIPLIVTNCMIMARAEAFAAKNALGLSLKDAFFTGLGFALVLLIIGAMRELIGQGTLLANAELLFGEAGRALTWRALENYSGFLIAVLPPGAFFALGLLIALKNGRDIKRHEQAVQAPALDGVADGVHQ